MSKKIIVVILILIVGITCKKETPAPPIPVTQVEFNGFKERTVEMRHTVKFEGYIMGADLNRNEIYIQGVPKLKRMHNILIADIQTGKIKKEKPVPMGTLQSPAGFFNPSYMQYLEGRYFIIDQFHKILVYDEQLNYLYTNMFAMHRFIVDFYSEGGKTFFVMGCKRYGGKLMQNNVGLFHFTENKKPSHFKWIHCFTFKSLQTKNRQNRKLNYMGSPWPSGTGFERNGKIYYANYDEKKYYMYDLGEDQEYAFELGYLKPKTYSLEDSNRLEFLHSNGWEKDIFKRSGIRYIAEPYPEPLYQFGVYDVGKGKIGIIGDIDIEKDIFEFRLDVLDAATGKYLESIRLPFGVYFRETITDGARGVHYTYIDVDKGIYLWNNAEGEELIDYTNITSLKILREPKETQ